MSNYTKLHVTGEDINATAREIEEVEEIHQQLVEWTTGDVF